MLLSVLLQATNVRAELNTILADYGVPIIIAIMVVSIAVGLLKNMDKIIDANGEGTRKEGVVNVIWYVFYVILFIIVVGGSITLLNAQFNMSI
jgi:hypothetical protein